MIRVTRLDGSSMVVNDDQIDKRVVNLYDAKWLVDSVPSWYKVGQRCSLARLQSCLGHFSGVESFEPGKDGFTRRRLQVLGRTA